MRKKIAEDAEKTIEKIQEAERACIESNFCDIKAAKAFALSWQHLDKLRTEFSSLRGSGVEFQDFAKPKPIFPSTAGLIATETDASRKGRIFAIFEKQDKE